jgi:hypothetical protein
MNIINSFKIITTLFVKSLLTSLYQREDLYPSLAKRGKGRFFDLCKFNFETVINNLEIYFIGGRGIWQESKR